MDFVKVVVVSIILIVVVSFSTIFWYFGSTEVITVTSVIKEKYMYESTDVVINVGDEDCPIGIPIKSMKYILVLEDKSKHKVSYDKFWEYEIGEQFNYSKRVWK